LRQWEKGQSIPDNYSTLIIDTIGLLRSIYRYATLAYVGGGFGGEGIHNVLEATVYGKPVVIGPVYDKFIEATELVERKGILVVNNAIELETQLSELLKDASLRESIGQIAKQFTHDRGGAAQRVIQLIQEKRLLTK
jgi:3-deoxy-D-manno-octulosonic-acid transferase